MTISVDVKIQLGQSAYLQQFICELQYAPGKWRPETFWLPRDTQLGDTIVENTRFIKVIEKLTK
jgi:hypothetical protein